MGGTLARGGGLSSAPPCPWRAARTRLAGVERLPQGIPSSWYLVAWSDEVPAGELVRLRYLEREMVAFRGADGAVSVLDAYCPHLGAHLGVGGRVEGGTLRCPFQDRKSTRLNSSHLDISYAVFCLKKKNTM